MRKLAKLLQEKSKISKLCSKMISFKISRLKVRSRLIPHNNVGIRMGSKDAKRTRLVRRRFIFPTHTIRMVALQPLHRSRLDLYQDGLSPAQLLVGIDGNPVTVDADAPLAVPLRVAEEVIQRPPPAVPATAGFGITVVDLAVIPGGIGPAPEQVWRREGLRLVVLRQTMVEGRSGSVRGRGGCLLWRRGGGGGDGVAGGGRGGEGIAVGERDVISAEVGVGVVLLEVVLVEVDGPAGGGRHGWVAASRTQEVEGGFGSVATATIKQ